MGNAWHDNDAGGAGPFEFSLGDELRGERATLGKTLLDIQRDLRIKAAYIAAIEDCKPEVFPNPSFIAGYVRSYARYLGLDPDAVYQRFCRESGFTGRAGAGVVSAPKPTAKKAAGGGFVSPIARLEGGLPRVPLAAIGSVLLMMALTAGLGYGGWMVLQNIQRVQFSPVEDLPVAVAEMQPLNAPETAPLANPGYTDLAEPVTSTALADLYRQQELEVPIVAPRDGPIAALDPDAVGLLARPSASADALAAAAEVPPGLVQGGGAIPELVAAVAAPDAGPKPVTVVAEKAAWIRVYLENGTVLYESILEKGQSYTPPDGSETPRVWAGNSGSVYARIGDTLYGPLGRGTRAAKDVSLTPEAIRTKYSEVTEVPEVISQSIGVAPPTAEPAVAIQ
jgi:cytoskeleton protein RodZ